MEMNADLVGAGFRHDRQYEGIGCAGRDVPVLRAQNVRRVEVCEERV